MTMTKSRCGIGARDAVRARRVIAHRGASADAPEHTFASYDLALEQGADYIEIDVQMTLDGVLVAIHDPHLGRTGQRRNFCVASRSLDELKRCDVGTWFNRAHRAKSSPAFFGLKVPTLEEIFVRYGKDANYYIEPKEPHRYRRMEAELLRLLKRYGLKREAERDARVVIQSFSASSLRLINRLEPRIPLVQLVHERHRRMTSTSFDRIRAYAIGIGAHASMPGAWIDQAHNRNLLVHPYTVNSLAWMRRLLASGVDGIFTDRPAELRALIESSRRRATQREPGCEMNAGPILRHKKINKDSASDSPVASESAGLSTMSAS